LNFPSLEETVGDHEYASLIHSFYKEIVAHLQVLLMSVDRYFNLGMTETYEEWIMNPYSLHLDKMADYGELKENLIELHSNRAHGKAICA